MSFAGTHIFPFTSKYMTKVSGNPIKILRYVLSNTVELIATNLFCYLEVPYDIISLRLNRAHNVR